MRWIDLTPAEQRSRKKAWRELSALNSRMGLDGSHFARRGTDAGIALYEAATTDEARYRDVARRIDDARAAVERNGRWDDRYEWRIFTEGTESIERIDGGFRAGADFNGRFRADFATFGEAWEAAKVLANLGMSLFYALSWTSSSSIPDLEAKPDRPTAEAYLKRLARDTAASPPELDERSDGSRTLSIVTAPPPTDWADPPESILVVTVRSGSLLLECDCTTPERAHLFLGVFDALVADLLEILDWQPLA